MSDNDLRSKLIRLAHENPDIRAKLLPVLEVTAAGKKKDTPSLRDPFHSFADGFHELARVVNSKEFASDAKLKAALKKLSDAYKDFHDTMDAGYDWD